MGAASATPEKLVEYSDAMTHATGELAAWVRGVLNRRIFDYQSGAIDFGNDIPGLSGSHRGRDTIGIEVDSLLTRMYATDQQVRAVGDAFARAGGYSTLDPPFQLLTVVHTTDAALDANSPLGIARRLLGNSGALHPINVSPEQLKAVKEASAETGVSERLLLAILWQEQQWYQNDEPGLWGPERVAAFYADFYGQVASKWGYWLGGWSSDEQDKSLGITHLKLGTVRRVMEANRAAFTMDGRFLGDLNDGQLLAYVERNPDEDIRITAYYMRLMSENPHGASSDKQLFMLYAYDKEARRDANASYHDGDGLANYRPRALNWDHLQQPLDDAAAWASLAEAQRRQALAQLASETPRGRPLDLHPLYAPPGVATKTTGTYP
ncbi:hypothetical protein [Streptomyces sp. NPDC002172]